MKRIATAVFASLLLAASPVFAHGGHGHDKHHDKHAEKEWKKERKAWEKEQKHWAKHGRAYSEREIVHNYYYPAPRVVEHRYYAEQPAYVSPAPVVIGTPGVFINFSN